MSKVIPLASELEAAAEVLAGLGPGNAYPANDLFPRAVNLLRSRARALRKREEPHTATHKTIVGKVGFRHGKGSTVKIKVNGDYEEAMAPE